MQNAEQNQTQAPGLQVPFPAEAEAVEAADSDASSVRCPLLFVELKTH